MTRPPLKPCPFCGRKPHIDSMIFRDIGKAFLVSCESRRCGVNPGTNHRATRAEAVAAWILRAGEEMK